MRTALIAARTASLAIAACSCILPLGIVHADTGHEVSAHAAPSVAASPAKEAAAHPAAPSTAEAPASHATFAETIDWLKKKASFREELGGFVPYSGDDNDDSASTTPPAKQVYAVRHTFDYAPQDGMLTVTDETFIGDNRLSAFRTSLPLSKLDMKVGQNPENPRQVRLTCTGPLKLFQQVTEDNIAGQRTEDYFDHFDLTFDNVNTAERAVQALRHLTKLVAGTGPAKPANEPF